MKFETLLFKKNEITPKIRQAVDEIVERAWLNADRSIPAVFGDVNIISFFNGTPTGYLSSKEYDQNNESPYKAFLDFIVFDLTTDPLEPKKLSALSILMHFRTYIQSRGYSRIFSNSRSVVWGENPRIFNRLPNFSIINTLQASPTEQYSNIIYNAIGPSYAADIIEFRNKLFLHFFWNLKNIMDKLQPNHEEYMFLMMITNDLNLDSDISTLKQLVTEADNYPEITNLVNFDIINKYIRLME